MIRMKTDCGAITVDNAVYTNIAGYAATNCFGVKGMAVRSMTDGLVHLLRREAPGVKNLDLRFLQHRPVVRKKRLRRDFRHVLRTAKPRHGIVLALAEDAAQAQGGVGPLVEVLAHGGTSEDLLSEVVRGTTLRGLHLNGGMVDRRIDHFESEQ